MAARTDLWFGLPDIFPETIQQSLVFWRVGNVLSKWIWPIEIILENRSVPRSVRCDWLKKGSAIEFESSIQWHLNWNRVDNRWCYESRQLWMTLDSSYPVIALEYRLPDPSSRKILQYQKCMHIFLFQI